MEPDEATSDDLNRVKVTIKTFIRDYQIAGFDPSSAENKPMTITVPLTKRDYRKLKEAFDLGKLKDFAIRSVDSEPLDAAAQERTGFAKSEEQKRKPRPNPDSTPDRP